MLEDVSALLPLIVSNALNAVAAILILLVGLWLSGRANLLAVTMLRRTPHIDPMLQSFFGSLATCHMPQTRRGGGCTVAKVLFHQNHRLSRTVSRASIGHPESGSREISLPR